MRSILAMACALVLIAGCATAPVAGVPADTETADTADTPLGRISQLAQADVQAALDDANAHGDVIAAQCYAHILAVIPTLPNAAAAPKGVVSAFQKARNIRRRVDQGISDEFTLACGPLITDTRRTALKIGARIGTAGALPF